MHNPHKKLKYKPVFKLEIKKMEAIFPIENEVAHQVIINNIINLKKKILKSWEKLLALRVII